LEDLTPEQFKPLVELSRELSPKATIECSGRITLENVQAYADAGADLIAVSELTASVRHVEVSLQIQLF
jgi:nicotinate-nucleotide pyrophosphorylase (carboxylating)